MLLFLPSQYWDCEYGPPHFTHECWNFSSWAISSTCPCLLERPSLCVTCDSRLRINKPLWGKSACKRLEVWQVKMASVTQSCFVAVLLFVQLLNNIDNILGCTETDCWADRWGFASSVQGLSPLCRYLSAKWWPVMSLLLVTTIHT